MTILRFIASVWLYVSLLPTVYVVAPILSLFTKPDFEDKEQYRWGRIYGTHDNPPQGDRAWVSKHCPYPEVFDGWRGWVNRTLWLYRNKLYNLKLQLSLTYSPYTVKEYVGDPNISDKYKVPGWLYVKVTEQGKTVGWEWYSVTPYSSGRCVRIRMGWKIKSDKFSSPGDKAQLVFTFNPFDGYGSK